MLHLKFIAAVVIALALLGLVSTASTAYADDSFSVQAAGFSKNEHVATWVTLSDGSTIDLGQVQADENGNVSFDVTPDSGWSAGEVIAVAHGISSGHEYATKFVISAPTDSTDSEDVSYGDGSVIGNPSDSMSITYHGTGYTPGELVWTWYQSPSNLNGGPAVALPDVYADASGNVEFVFTAQDGWEFGNYHITAEGSESKHVTYNTFSFFGTVSEQRTYWNYDTDEPITSATWQGQYYDNATLSGSPVLTRTDADLNFNWGSGSPDAAVPADNFSVKWDTSATVTTAGNYVISATMDDGMRVWVDGNLVIDEWYPQTPTTYYAAVYLGEGVHSVHVEYFEEYGDAVAVVGIEQE